MSGSATTTPGFPPYFGFFASISPKVLDTLTFIISNLLIVFLGKLDRVQGE
jgi:hypothetical protein